MADDDGALLIGVVLGLIAAAVVGTNLVTDSPSSASASASTHSGSTYAPSAAVQQLPKCTRVQRVMSNDGTTDMMIPISSERSRNCTLRPGDSGPPVTALQHSLSLCMHQPVPTNGVYGASTGQAVADAGRVAGGSQAWYQPAAAQHLTWPWYAVSTGAFTGDCSYIGTAHFTG